MHVVLAVPVGMLAKQLVIPTSEMLDISCAQPSLFRRQRLSRFCRFHWLQVRLEENLPP